MALKVHVSFSVPTKENLGQRIVNHFSSLGHHLVDQSPGTWKFHRGSKSAALWRFNIRSYETILAVQTGILPNGETWVSCDFEVWTFLTIATGADVATLEAEGRQLESVIRIGR